MMKKEYRTAIWICVGLLILLAVIYFLPVLSGKEIVQPDMISSRGMAHSAQEYEKRFGEPAYWTPSMFSGMPTYMIGSVDRYSIFEKWSGLFLRAGIPYPIGSMIYALIGFFLCLLFLDVHPFLSAAGAVAYGFFSYHIQIIEAGHVTKFITLSLAPWVFFSLILLFRYRKWLLGFALLSFFSALVILANHIQMVYYMAFIWVAYGIYELIRIGRQEGWLVSLKLTGVITGALLLALLTIAAKYDMVYEYAQYSIRGPSELVRDKNTSAGKGGLDKDYAFQWSYGKAELLTLIIPNAAGGSSNQALDTKSHTYKFLASQNIPNARQIIQSLPTYWGDQPFVSGGIYFGAVVFFFLILALGSWSDPMKVLFLEILILGILLSLGSHSPHILNALGILALPLIYYGIRDKVKMNPFWLGTFLTFLGILLLTVFDLKTGDEGMSLVDFFFDYVPLYNKFRVPTSQLVIVAFIAPLLAMKGTQAYFEELNQEEQRKLLKNVTVTLGILLLFLAIFPESLFSFESPNDAQYPPQYKPFLDAIREDRIALFQADAWRSLIFVLLSAAGLFLYQKGILKSFTGVEIWVFALTTIDMVSIAYRYLNKSHYKKPKLIEQQYLQPLEYETWLLQNDTTYYRVFPASRNPFNDGHTPYYLNTIGGYHPAKLKRYQQLIEAHISKFNFRVLNMLNMKYLITRDTLFLPYLRPVYISKSTGEVVYENLANYGPAWFVEKVLVVDIPDQALDTIGKIETNRIAVIEKKDETYLSPISNEPIDSTEYIKLIYHDNRRMVYEANAKKPRFAVFSEIYYPKGWEATIDGKQAHIFHANFVLRGLIVPPGKHKIVFYFNPVHLKRFAWVSFTASIVILLLLLFALYSEWKHIKKSDSIEN